MSKRAEAPAFAPVLAPVLALFGALVLIAAPAGAQDVVRGRLHVVWDGAARGTEAEYFVVPIDGGAATRLRVSPQVEATGTLLALDRQLVEARVGAARRAADQPGSMPEAELLSVSPLALSQRRSDDASIVGPTGPPQILDFVTVLCRFADDPNSPVNVSEVETVHGASYPGLRYHYREMSGDPAVMAGSRVVGWYTMPLPRSAYVSGTSSNFGAVANDCASQAQADVDFSAFHGINLQLNGAFSTRPTAPFDTLSFGGSWTLTLDGVTRSWGVTWLSGLHAKNYVVVHHEVGHAAGWPHSSGDYGQEYDSNWDLMSRGYLRYELPWGWQSVHTIASHKDAVGWIPSARLLDPAPATRASARIARSALPPPTGYLMARVPGLDGRWYAIEARMPAGLDTPLPGSAIVIHEVRSGIRSYVVDATMDGNPNDAGAMWTVGEEFTDAAAGVRVRVDAAVADGFDVTITRGWEVAVTILGPGEVTSSAPGVGAETCDASCSRLFGERGATILLQATPDAGKAFLGWTGACTSVGACQFPLWSNSAVTARFGTAPLFLKTTVVGGTMGKYYADSLEIDTGGGAPVWSVVAGSLPPGLLLGASNGRITGFPAAAGAFAFTIRVTSGPFQIEQAVSIAIDKPVLALDAVIQALLGTSALSMDELMFLDLLGNANSQLDIGDVRAWLIDASYLTPAQRASVRPLMAARGKAP